jgi:hypothetical protein
MAAVAAASTRRALLAAAPLRVRGVHATAALRRAGQCPVARWPRPSPRTRAMLVCARAAARELERTTRQHVQAPVGPQWITWAGCPCVHTLKKKERADPYVHRLGKFNFWAKLH